MRNHSNSHKFKGIVTSMSRNSIICYPMEHMQKQSNLLRKSRIVTLCYVQTPNLLLPNGTNTNTEQFSLKQKKCDSLLCPDAQSFATYWNKCKHREILLKQNKCASMLCPDTRSFATQWNKCQRRANVFETKES